MNKCTGACLSVCKLLHAEMLLLHLFLFWRGDAQSFIRSIMEGESSPCSSLAITKHVAAHNPMAASHYQKTPALLKDVKSWKLPKGSVRKHHTSPIRHPSFPFFLLCSIIQQIHFISLSDSKLVGRKT